MSTTRRAGRWAGRKLARRIGKSVPFVGAMVSAAFLYDTMKRKGAVPGLADAVLNSIPFFGALKNGIELITDDWIPDRPGASSPSSARSRPRSMPGRRIRGA